MSNIKVIIDCRMVTKELHGIARYTYELIKGNNNRVNYYLLVNDIEKGKEIFSGIDNINFIRMRSKFLSIKEQIELPIILNKYKDNAIFHSPSFVSSPFIKNKMIMTIHDLNHIKFPEFYSCFHKYYYKYIVKNSAKKSSKILTVSNFSKAELVEWLNCKEDKIVITYNGIDRKFLNNTIESNEYVKEKYNLPSRYILYIGNMKKHKNLKRLIDAMPLLNDRNIKLVINNKCTDEISRRIKLLGIEERIKFIGFIDEEDLPSIYNQSEVFVFPSLYEGFGLPPLEALMSGTRVVTSNNTALGEIFNNIAVTVNPYSSEEIAKGINESLILDNKRDDKLMKELMKLYNWDLLCQTTFEEYKKLKN